MAERKNVNNGDWDAKGDLLAGTANDAFDQVAVGANNTILTADSTVATGMKWAAPASPSGVVLVSDFDAKGDILVGTANDAFDQLAVGATNGQALIVDSAQSTGLKYDLPPGFQVGFAEKTTDTVVTSITEGTPDLVLSLGALTYLNRPHWFTFYCPAVTVTGAAAQLLHLWDDVTSISRVWQNNNDVNGTFNGPNFMFRYTPSAGSHTFKIMGWRSGGTSYTLEAAPWGGGAGTFGPIQFSSRVAV